LFFNGFFGETFVAVRHPDSIPLGTHTCWLVSAQSLSCFAHPEIRNLLQLFVFHKIYLILRIHKSFRCLFFHNLFLFILAKTNSWLFLHKTSFCLYFRKIYLILGIHKSFCYLFLHNLLLV
jgi:hypothetical protein